MAGKGVNLKIVMLGEGRVGKTSLVLRYCKDTFSDKQVSTIQASYLTKRINLGSTTCNLSIWDTAGQERFHALGPIYYRDADGALLVYDITDADSFTKVKQWVKELRKMVGNDIQIAVAGNKVDLERQRTVSEDDAIAFVQSVGGTHHGTSAKANRGIDPMFLDITKRK
jgi:Ras-related protein Rab-21